HFSFVIFHSSFFICHFSFVIFHLSFVIFHLSFVIRLPSSIRMPKFLKRLPLCLLLCAVSCSGDIPIPRIVFDTPMPTDTAPPSIPTITPLPTGSAGLTVHIPANTPPGSVPIIQILDEVGGTSA